MDIIRAGKIQNRLRQKLEIIPLGKKVETIVGVDAAFGEDRIIGVSCLFSFPDLKFLEEAWSLKKLSFPYIPGYLSFREAPALIAALKKLKVKPDLVLVLSFPLHNPPFHQGHLYGYIDNPVGWHSQDILPQDHHIGQFSCFDGTEFMLVK